MRFILKGLPLNISAQQLISLLPSDAVGPAKWAPWIVIPMQMIPAGRVCHWTVKADDSPPAARIILPIDIKVVIEKIDTPGEIAVKQHEAQTKKAEEAKARRRQTFQEEKSPGDPWQTYFDSKGKAKGKATADKSTTGRQPAAPPAAPASSSSDLLAIRQELTHLSARVDRQDIRIDSLEGTLTSQHNEVMNMLRALSLGSSSASASSQAPPGKSKRGSHNPILPA